MADAYLKWTNQPFGRTVAGFLGFPTPVLLRRQHCAWQPDLLAGHGVLIGAVNHSAVLNQLVGTVVELAGQIKVSADLAGLAAVKQAAANIHVPIHLSDPNARQVERFYVLDLTQAQTLEDIRLLYLFFKVRQRQFLEHSRIVVLAQTASAQLTPCVAGVQSAIAGFVRSFAKEIGGNGSTANLLWLSSGAEAVLPGVLRFFLSDASAFVTGQAIVLKGLSSNQSLIPFASKPLTGQCAVVTGAAKGIGAAIARVLAREGATVVGVDLPHEEAALGLTMSSIQGLVCTLNLAEPNAGQMLAELIRQQYGKIDIVVHNAGITRDKKLRNMNPDQWDSVLSVNLDAVMRCNKALFDSVLSPTARMVCIASISGIAGNVGQTNYAASKSGLIGYVQALSANPPWPGFAVNAVAPGLIETEMTARMPALSRFVGRRLNSLSQGGLPIDVAEAVAFLSSPLAAGISGQVLRVCGQNVLGQ